MEESETDPLLPITVEEPTQIDGSVTLVNEFKTLSKLAIPVLTASVVSYSIVMAPILSLGHMGTKYLAAIALTTAFCNVTGFSVGAGMATALDTLCSQSYTGSTDKYIIGKHLQRGIFIQFLLCIPVIGLWLLTEPLLVFLGQDKEVAKLSGEFALYLIPGLFPYLAFKCLSSYLQSQGIMVAGFYVMVIAAPINAFLQWYLVWSSHAIGAIGAPIATSITNILIAILGFGYAYFIEGGEAFGGFELKEICDISQLLISIQIGFPGVLMLCSEWWVFEIVSLMAGWLGDEMLAAQSVMLNIGAIMYCVPLGLSVASSTRIGNTLGSNLPKTATKVAKSSIMLATILATMNCLLLLSVRNQLGYLFSSDEVVLQLVSDVLPLAAFFQFADGLGCVGGGILRGCRRQKLGASVNLAGYYIIALPLSFLFTFYFQFQLLGLWMGLCAGLWFVGIFDMVYISQFVNFEDEARRALELIRSTDSNPHI